VRFNHNTTTGVVRVDVASISSFAASYSAAATEASDQLARSAEVKKHVAYDGKVDQLNDQFSYKRY